MIRFLANPLPPLSRQEVVSLSQSSCVSTVGLIDGRRGKEGCARSQIIRVLESHAPVVYKSFNTLL
jgi:hypothetical protein